ncbi:MAG: NUDIX hydrolase [Lachnospiraceae bacterium]|jgi:ADP-ribose pyrophosphatase|nr:NUDIX hydrolase [Lachnospiraceae bacterium]MCH4030402.1 NUDIX hydrolase [Lachnospiraceae bacterium]MCH4069614.1 NUDIX hydrolase [Lachnospiraceae bacterium]MCH4107450.1 NUDIX hydrolase [Lachnospiraceae bacterium]MCI1301699.1 NUDIX hydrolase [Lachnospiraceae bacterium]
MTAAKDPKQHIRRTGREVVYQGSILKFCKDTIQTPDGRTEYYDFIDHSRAAACVAVNNEGKILLVRQYREAIDRIATEIPAGGINKGETSMQAAARELEEETGYRARSITPLLSEITAIAYCNEVVDVFLAQDLEKTSQHLDPDESIAPLFLSPEEFIREVSEGNIQDSKTIAAVTTWIARQLAEIRQ